LAGSTIDTGESSFQERQAVDKKIVVIQAEAEAVRTIFARYLELGSLRVLRPARGLRGIYKSQAHDGWHLRETELKPFFDPDEAIFGL
jgi:hypothetical protein